VKPKRHQNKELLKEKAKDPCVLCRKHPAGEVHHIKPKGSGGGDWDHNTVSMCRFCHTMTHQLGLLRVTKLYPKFKELIERMGWQYDLVLLRWTHSENFSPHQESA
jgi:hypothetical protein